MSSTEQTERFLKLYNREQRRIYSYIRSLLFRPDDAEEVFQETCIALWRAFDQFQEGTNFGVWSRQVARNRVLAYGKKRQRDRSRLCFGSEVLHLLAEDVERDADLIQMRQEALSTCVEKLSPSDRDLVRRRYSSNKTTVQVAEELDSSLNTLYKALQRIRRWLLRCIERTMNQEEHVV